MLESFNVFSVLMAIATIILIYLRHRYTYWSRHGVNGPNYVSVRAMWQKVINISMEKNRKYGRIYGSYLFTNKWLTINEPELIRDIAVKDFHIFPNKYDMNYGKTYITSSLFLMKGDHNWRRVRSVVTPAFTTGKLLSMMASIEGIADKFVITLDTFAKNGETVDMRKYLSAFAMDVISACAYGINVESINNPNHPIVVNAKKILSVDSTLSYAVSGLLPPIARLLRLEPFDTNAIKFMDLLVKDIVNKRKISTNKLINEGKKKSDFLQLMIDSERNDKDLDLDNNNNIKIQKSGENANKKTVKALSETELTAQGFTFFIAGYDTTSASLSHVVYYLSQNKDKQQILREELNALDTDFTYENLNQCQYLKAVIDETLRLAPPLASVQRECIRDYKLGNTGITIPAGTFVEFQPNVIHRDPECFPDPDQFKPERFINPTHHPYAYLPFGCGPRQCVGMRFALNVMQICIAKIVHRFEFTLAPGFQIDYYSGSVFLIPKQVMVTITSRL